MNGFDVSVYNKGRKMSMANESNINRQQDNRLALKLQRIDKNRESALRRISSTIELPKVQLSPRKISHQELSSITPTINMEHNHQDMNTIRRISSFHNLKPGKISPVPARSRSTTTAPYTSLLDVDRFKKFCSDTNKLKQQSDNSFVEDSFNGDMNIHLRENNLSPSRSAMNGMVATRKKSQHSVEDEEDSDSIADEDLTINWDEFTHPRSNIVVLPELDFKK